MCFFDLVLDWRKKKREKGGCRGDHVLLSAAGSNSSRFLQVNLQQQQPWWCTETNVSRQQQQQQQQLQQQRFQPPWAPDDPGTNLQHMILLAPYWGLQIITLVAVASSTSSNRLTFVEHSSKITEHQNYLIISIQKIITQKSKNTHKRKKKTTHFFVGVCCGCALSVCQGQAL